MGRKEVSRITFATIGSVINHPELFQHFRNIIIDECHLVNPKDGMYKEFLSILKCKVLGLTATPYRLSSSRDFGAILKFITRTRPCVFSEVIYQVQVSTLLDMGYLAKLNYYPLPPPAWDGSRLKVNTTGADYTDKSVVQEYERIDFYGWPVQIVNRLLYNKVTGIKRRGILIFTRFLKETERLTESIPGTAIVSGTTPKKEREQILEAFKSGTIPIVGRAIRPHPSKEFGWIIDLCGNLKRFGEVKDLRLHDTGGGKWAVFSKNRQLTNVYFKS